jgi:hypothetical protein
MPLKRIIEVMGGMFSHLQGTSGHWEINRGYLEVNSEFGSQRFLDKTPTNPSEPVTPVNRYTFFLHPFGV